MTIATAILDRMIVLMKADSTFDTIKVFVRGAAVTIADQHMPNCELNTSPPRKESEMTGGRMVFIYPVQLRFFGQYQDKLTVTDRVATSAGYTAVIDYADAARQLFKQYRNLNSLTGSSWAVQRLNVTDGDTSLYDPRTQNIENASSVLIEVQVLETLP